MYISSLNLWCPWFLRQTLPPGLYSQGVDLICTSCSCKRLQLLFLDPPPPTLKAKTIQSLFSLEFMETVIKSLYCPALILQK